MNQSSFVSRRTILGAFPALGLLSATGSLAGCAAAAGGGAVAEGGAVAAAGSLPVWGKVFKNIGIGIASNLGSDGFSRLAQAAWRSIEDRNIYDGSIDYIYLDPRILEGDVSDGKVYATTISVYQGNTWKKPDPIMFALDGEMLNLRPRAVRSVSAFRPALINDGSYGVTDANAARYFLPVTAWLTGGSYVDVSYQTVAGRVQVTYNEARSTETVTVSGLPGGRTATGVFHINAAEEIVSASNA